MTPLERTRTRIEEWGRAAFVARYPNGFLLRRPRAPEAGHGTGELPDDGGTARFGADTRLIRREALDEDLWTGELLDEVGWVVAEVMKRAGVLPLDRITLGRMRSCDVVLRHPAVSKMQAHLQLDRGHVASVSDARSSNGTFVNGRRLAPDERCPIVFGDRLAFGALEFEYASAATVCVALVP